MRTQLGYLVKGDHITLYISERVAFNKWYAKVKGIYQGQVAKELGTVDRDRGDQNLAFEIWIKDERDRDIYIPISDIAHVEQHNGTQTKSIS